MKQNSEKSKKQKNPKLEAILDLNSLVKKIHSRQLYILDASAVLNDPKIEDYYKEYKKIKKRATFVITTALLREIDDIRHSKSTIAKKHKTFMLNLIRYCKKGKLSSKERSINGNTNIIYLPFNLVKIKNEKYNWLTDDYPDKQLLCLTIELRKLNKKVSIISADTLLKILCVEERINYIFIPPKIDKIETETTPLPKTGSKPEVQYEVEELEKKQKKIEK